MLSRGGYSGYTRTTRVMRGLLLLASLLVAIAGVQLFVLSESTDRFFAWTVQPPITAAFLGAGYWASFALQILAARQPLWAYARIAVPTALTFTILTTVATFLHLGRFHFNSPAPETQVALWAWIGVYVVVPLLLLGALLTQARRPVYDPPRKERFPSLLRWLLVAQGIVMLVLGAALFIMPEAFSPIWPWQLMPLTARAVAAWLVGVAVAALHAAIENEMVRVRPAVVSYLLFGLLQGVVLLRYSSLMQWQEPGAWVYLAFVLAIIATSLAALVAGFRAEQVKS
jgi:hypothetical protein